MFYGIRIGAAIAALVVCSSSTPRAIGAADALLEWNQIALTRALNATPAQAPVEQVRTMAIVQVSVHDAVSGITGQYETYSSPGPAPANASPVAAAIAAAHHALRGLFPGQASETSLDASYATSLSTHGVSTMDPGLDFGRSVAAGILALRANDHASEAQFDYTVPGAGAPGVWTRLGGAAALLPGWGAVTPFVLRSGSQFRPDGPPARDSEQYARDYNEILEIGSFSSTVRSTEQTGIANFWRASPTAHLERRPHPGARGTESRPGRDSPGVRAHVSGGEPTRASRAGRRNTTTISGGRSRRSSMAIWMATLRPPGTAHGARCLRRRHTLNTCPATARTAVRWRPCCSKCSATIRASSSS